MITANTFSQKSDLYAVARPDYPKETYEWIVSKCASQDVAWDCATGNGQAAKHIAEYFAKVYATDISQEQVNNGFLELNIDYSQSEAERTSFEDSSFDLITVAQALHWFDYDKFWPEVTRVGKDGALFCAWGYSWFECDKAIMKDLVEPFLELINPYWAEKNQILWDRFKATDVSFPFERIETPSFSIDISWTLTDLMDYLKTWSAYKLAMEQKHHEHALNSLFKETLKSFSADMRLDVSMPIFMLAGYVKK